MKTRFLFPAIILLFPFFTSHAQGFRPPSSGKAVVYFVRLSTTGFAIAFDFYDNDKFIGAFAGRNYMRYETNPGEHLFWASSENFEFLPSELKAGGSYVVLVDVDMGIAMARVGLTPVGLQDGRLERVKKLVNKKTDRNSTRKELAESNEARAQHIRETLEKYDGKWKKERTYRHLGADMAIPEDRLIATADAQ